MKEEGYFLGIDLGSQGLRVVITDPKGQVMSSSDAPMELTADLRREQDTDVWWDLCLRCIRSSVSSVDASVRKRIIAIGVTSTSGTVIPLDKRYNPLHKAIMYSDDRSAEQGRRVSAIANEWVKGGFTNFNSSTGLAKIVWFIDNFPEKVPLIGKWIHASDFITGKLSGNYEETDYTNVLKTGFDLSALEWPDYLFRELPLEKSWVQKVVPSGTVIGCLTVEVAKEIRLTTDVKVVVGLTDGCASQVASGAMRPGQWNTTIGTTLVVKGVTKEKVNDPLGRVYNHRHPEGYWMPGGAGNIGADWVSQNYRDDLESLNEQAMLLAPTRQIAYPLLQQGERFPFIAPQARGFAPEGLTRAELFTAQMEGVAYVECYAYNMIRGLSGEGVEAIFTAGGASNSLTWLKIRSSVLDKPVYKMKFGSGAVGAAIVAASQTWYSSLSEAASEMVQPETEILPDREWVKIYEEGYHRFLEELRERGYLNED